MDQNLSKLGLVDFEGLDKLANERPPYIVEDFILKPSINIVAGDSGLGKSALCAQLAMCIAAGIDFFGHHIEDPGPVLYCDAEGQPATMGPMMSALAAYLGLSGVPKEFFFWNPNWNIHDKDTVISQDKHQLYRLVKKIKPRLVVLDSLRNFYPLSIKDQEHAAVMIKEMRRYSGETGCAWMIVHHLRKANKDEKANNSRPTVKYSVLAWLQEAAGTLALINNTDLRLGWEQDPAIGVYDTLWLGGLLRVLGAIGPYKVCRNLDTEGEAIGYRLASPMEQLNQSEHDIYDQLPENEEFMFDFLVKDLKKKGGTASRFIKRCKDLKLIEIAKELPPKVVGGRPRKVYIKVGQPVE